MLSVPEDGNGKTSLILRVRLKVEFPYEPKIVMGVGNAAGRLFRAAKFPA